MLLLGVWWHPNLGVLVEERFRLVDLSGEVLTTATIWVVQHDDLSVLLADHLFGKTSLSEHKVSKVLVATDGWQTYETPRIKAASLLFMVFSNPPL